MKRWHNKLYAKSKNKCNKEISRKINLFKLTQELENLNNSIGFKCSHKENIPTTFIQYLFLPNYHISVNTNPKLGNKKHCQS